MSCYPTDQAFPSPGMPFVNAETGVPHDPFAGHGWMRDPRDGLSKRELAAFMALQGAIANPGRHCSPQEYADFAVVCADTLLRELAK